MGPKKKAQSHTQTKQAPSATISSTNIINRMRTIKTSDGTVFQISDSLLVRFSGYCKKLIEQFKADQIIQFEQVGKDSFKYVFEFFTNRKDRDAHPIHYPLKSNTNIRHVMDENDALLMQRIKKEGGDALVKELLDLATMLEISEMRERLFVLVAFKLMQFTTDELKEMYDIPNIKVDEQALKVQTKQHLEDLKKKNFGGTVGGTGAGDTNKNSSSEKNSNNNSVGDKSTASGDKGNSEKNDKKMDEE